MAIDPLSIQNGITAYRAGKSMSGADTGGAENAGRSFSDMVSNAASDAMETVRAADATGQAGLTGKANLQQVVEATMAMESTVKVTVALRDQVVTAYQEILRMPV